MNILLKTRYLLVFFLVIFMYGCNNDKKKENDSNGNAFEDVQVPSSSLNKNDTCFGFETAKFTIKQYNYKGELNETLHVITSNFGNRIRQDKTKHVTSERENASFTTYWKLGGRYKFITDKGDQYVNTANPDALFIEESDTPPYPVVWAARYCRLDQNMVEQTGYTYARKEYLGVICDVYTNKEAKKELWFYEGLRMKYIWTSSNGYENRELVTSFTVDNPIEEEQITPPEKPEENKPLEDDTTDDPCQFPDLSGIWACEGKGYFELRQTNQEIDGDCISFLEGKFVRYNCTEDLWAMSQKNVNYVRGKIVNGKYTIEIFPNKKDNIAATRLRTTLSGTLGIGAKTINPLMQYGVNNVSLGNRIDPHSGKSQPFLDWKSPPPITLNNSKCDFKKTSQYALQEAGSFPCIKCKKQELEEGLSFDDSRYTMTDSKLYKEVGDALNPLYTVSSGLIREGSPKHSFFYTADLMNDLINKVPRYNIRITKVERDGRYIDVFYEICDWKTGTKKKLRKIYHIDGLSEEELNLPDDDSIIQREYGKAGALVFTSGVLKEVTKP